MIKKIINWFEKNNVLSWIITILLAIIIFYISSLVFEPSGKGGFDIKPIAYHIVIFFVFGFFLLISLVKGKYKNRILLAILIAFLYAISDELHQFFVPGRSCSIFDVWLDFTGVLMAGVLYIWINYTKKKELEYIYQD